VAHPDPNGPADLTPVRIGEVWENPVTRERATLLEFPNNNPEGRASAELTALVGARVVGEHRHPALVERFTVREGELSVKRDGRTSILREGETAVVEPGVWHDWWNAGDRDARVLVEVTPGERFAHMIETLFGLARLGYTPPQVVQRVVFGALAPIAHARGYRATYPQISRTVLAPRL
jgi:quercetin dioxygenase-like cupin family protein